MNERDVNSFQPDIALMLGITSCAEFLYIFAWSVWSVHDRTRTIPEIVYHLSPTVLGLFLHVPDVILL